MSGELTNAQAWQVLNGLSHVGPVTVDKLLGHFGGDVLQIFKAEKAELKGVEGVGSTIAEGIVKWHEDFNLEKDLEKMKGLGAEFLHREHEDFPPLLKEIYDPPLGLYARGKFRPGVKSIAIVGSRRATLYGQGVAKDMARELAQMGFCVVSGMARGIDSAAHLGALDAGGPTVAVLGTGVDLVYPPENKELYDRIQESGAVLSEFYIGRRADKRTFPMRNRIVSGMCQAVVVVETASKGGSMITARMGGEQGRQVFAVPGRIDQASSQGCHELLRDGATLYTKVDDILEDLNYLKQMDLGLGSQAKGGEVPEEIVGDERKALQCLIEGEILGADAIAEKAGLSAPEAMSALLMLELKKVVVKRTDGMFEAALVGRAQPGGQDILRPPIM